MELIAGCELFAAPTRGACCRWIGKTLAVLTNGAFVRTGCPTLPTAGARRHCSAGARTMDEALVTFS